MYSSWQKNIFLLIKVRSVIDIFALNVMVVKYGALYFRPDIEFIGCSLLLRQQTPPSLPEVHNAFDLSAAFSRGLRCSVKGKATGGVK